MKSISNIEILKYLYNVYYINDSVNYNDTYISSFWKYFSNLFDVNIGDDGNLIQLSGKGFGVYKWSSLAHRILDELSICLHLLQLPYKTERIHMMIESLKICKTMGINMTFDAFRQVCTLFLFNKNIPEEILRRRIRILMIGDGYGLLSALFKIFYPNSLITMVDIGKTLLFQAYFCQNAYPNSVHKLVLDEALMNDVDFIYCPVESLSKLEIFKYDIAVNIASMQEMNNITVIRYFKFLRKCLNENNLFYCCNRELKILPGGEKSDFYKYPWNDEDRHLVNEICPWHQYFLSTQRSSKTPYIFGMRLPFINYYDGVHVHRLTRIFTNQ